MFGTFIDYWCYTDDSTYNGATLQAIVHQAASTRDFMPKNQTRTEGNDDQGFWAMTAMSAAECKFPDPPSDQPQYLALAQAVFNEYAQRWDADNCGGGLRWQIFSFNNGYNYKNAISNGCFFNIAARLARYTGNATYGEWATKVFEWGQTTGLINKAYGVYDGLTIDANKSCEGIDKTQWTYNAGIYMHGAAHMYNLTGKDVWRQRAEGILAEVRDKMVMSDLVYERFCELRAACNNDQQSFKGYLLRWMGQAAKLVPSMGAAVTPILRTSAQAAAAACVGSAAPRYQGSPGTVCGYSWIDNTYDGLSGVPPQMSALAALIAPLSVQARAPLSAATGGTSKGNPEAGSGKAPDPRALRPITPADRVGGGLLTLVLTVGVVGGTWFMVMS